ncbi:MAG: hypothetical protein KGY65_05255 [Candidatus Thermoplasmatota archaeon]|nr:hypothetical protein [Candidatus Thermoplasmatota archaeon]MBS3802141.1 hypothetical protein [Candidatus Thermoplasmatota archaeon]
MKKMKVIIVLVFMILPQFFVEVTAEKNLNQPMDNKYAVIVVGRYAGGFRELFPENFQKYYSWYLNAAGMAYSMLKDHYGYSDENIFLLASLREQFVIPDSFNPSWIDYKSNKENLKNVLYNFKPGGKFWMDGTDSLVFIYINHGSDQQKNINGKYAHNTFFGFPYEFNTIREMIRYFFFKKNPEAFKLYDWELGEYIENIHAARMLFILQPCYSGGFINELSGINHIIFTASKENEVATVSWIEPLLRGLSGKADANGDGKISLLEAYEYAARKVNEKTTDEHPLLDDNSDGIGHHFTDAGYNPCIPNSDGFFSARSYL